MSLCLLLSSKCMYTARSRRYSMKILIQIVSFLITTEKCRNSTQRIHVIVLSISSRIEQHMGICIPGLGYWERTTIPIYQRRRQFTWPVPSHYLNQCWNIVNLNLRNKLQWNLKRNSHIIIQENAFENVVCKMAPNSSRPQWVNSSLASYWCFMVK